MVAVDTAAIARLALVGDPASGKTTLCRYLIRCCAAARRGHCVLIGGRAHEYAGLDVRLLEDFAVPPADACGLVVIEDADQLSHEVLTRAMNEPARLVVITSYGPAAVAMTNAGFIDHSYGLYRRDVPRGWIAQGRLDWPADVTPTLAALRGWIDRPAHRWAGTATGLTYGQAS